MITFDISLLFVLDRNVEATQKKETALANKARKKKFYWYFLRGGRKKTN